MDDNRIENVSILSSESDMTNKPEESIIRLGVIFMCTFRINSVSKNLDRKRRRRRTNNHGEIQHNTRFTFLLLSNNHLLRYVT